MYQLVEIFESLQGEGRNTGKSCVFVRFAGCNLSCEWCDTSITSRFQLPLNDLIKEIKSYKSKRVILTGGEPTIVKNMPELIAKLKDDGYWIAVETNGTNEPDWFQFIDYIACSPKIEYSDKVKLTKADEIRVVASKSVKETIEFCNQIKSKIIATDYYISPCEIHGEIDFATAKEALNGLNDWALSVQLHKILGFR